MDAISGTGGIGRDRRLQLRRLMADATAHRRTRWSRRLTRLNLTEDVVAQAHLAQVAGDLEGRLTSSLARSVDVGCHLSRLATLHQIAFDPITRMLTSAETVWMSAVRARALAFAVNDMVEYAVATIPQGGTVELCLAIAEVDRHLVLGVGMQGDFGAVGSHDVSCALTRAIEIVDAVGGEFQRGVKGPRMVFGVTVPLAAGRAVAAGVRPPWG